MNLLLISFASVVGILLLALKWIGLRRLLGYELWIDVGLSVILTVAFFGTFAGMATALLSGAIISIVLLLLRPFVQAERWTPRKGWHRVGPTFSMRLRGTLERMVQEFGFVAALWGRDIWRHVRDWNATDYTGRSV